MGNSRSRTEIVVETLFLLPLSACFPLLLLCEEMHDLSLQALSSTSRSSGDRLRFLKVQDGGMLKIQRRVHGLMEVLGTEEQMSWTS
ncbi:hypothetical protein AFERRI_530021 [Acidithiobacillus ferrivorans]|uniref:Uncharacterized protein n=1 Tax=Acidithiobacillus ferrivorans TaxID=160808 RepID=A0A060US42_9PROT|nr:hypothetical protein AFERRI_530021 [Acidithiobacillus ferrivorans]